jgi:hypothetical protein
MIVEQTVEKRHLVRQREMRVYNTRIRRIIVISNNNSERGDVNRRRGGDFRYEGR